jgi:hypothetical protein
MKCRDKKNDDPRRVYEDLPSTQQMSAGRTGGQGKREETCRTVQRTGEVFYIIVPVQDFFCSAEPGPCPL